MYIQQTILLKKIIKFNEFSVYLKFNYFLTTFYSKQQDPHSYYPINCLSTAYQNFLHLGWAEKALSFIFSRDFPIKTTRSKDVLLLNQVH